METKSSIRPMTGQDLKDIWKRRRWWFLGIASLVAAATCVVVGFLPSSYRSDALILIEQPAVSEDYVKPLPGADDERQISRLVQQVLSHTLLQRLPMYRQQDISQQDFDDILKNVSIEVLRESSDPRRPAGKPYGLRVSFRSKTPKTAQEGGNELASVVVQEADQMTLDQARETGNVVRSQLQLALAKVQQTNQALADFRKEYAGRLPIEEQLTIETLARLQAQLDVNGQAIARARQTIADLQTPAQTPTLSQEGDKSSASAVDPNLAHLETDLQGEKIKLADLESRYKPNHPDVLKARDEIQRLEAQVKEEEAKNTAPKVSKAAKPSPDASAATISKIHDNEAELAARLKEQTQLQQDVARYQRNLSEMPSHAQQFSDLQREYDAAKKDYETTRDQAAAADQTTDVYQQHKGVHYRIQDYASLPDSPDLPVRWKLNLGGLAGGIFLGLLVAAFLEFRDNSFKSAQDVEYYMGVKNLALLPDIPSPSELQRARKSKYLWITGTATTAVVLAALNLYIYLVRL